MAINLNTLTSPATSGDVLAEALTTADFLEGVPVLRNLARGSQKGGDAKQGTALNQPKALPLDANGKGYLYLSGVSGNYASVPDATNLDGFGDFTFQVDNLYLPDWSPSAQVTPIAKGSSWQFSVHTSGSLRLDLSGVSSAFSDPTGLADKTTASIRAVRAGSVLTFFYSLNGGETWVSVPYNYGGGSGTLTNDPLPLAIGAANVSSTVLGKVSGAKVWNNATQSGTPVLDVDFTATKIRHNDTKFVCDSGQVVTINKSGNDPATIIKKPVLRFDGANDGLNGLFANNIDGGYMFAAFSVLGDGGSSDARVFSVNANGFLDYNTNGFVYGLKYASNNELASYGANAILWSHNDMYDDDRGDILYEAKAKSGGLISVVNNANKFQLSTTLATASNEFNVGNGSSSLARPAAIDLEYLALFPATITDAQADDVRNYINNRNNVFSLIDSQGYYFFDGAATSANQVFTGSSSWPGRIVGSDNDDIFKYLSNPTHNDRPTTDGYKINFADNSDHFLFNTPLTGGQAGWQIVGTSLGTFAYRVNNTAVTELNLLGNLGSASHRKAGQSYGMILLPESATGADIEDARKLLIDRGASDAANTTTFENYWRDRGDIVEFQFIDTSTVTDFSFAWFNTRLTSFPFIDTSNGTNFFYAFYDTRLASFPALDMSKGTNFSNAWNSVSTLSSFPAGAKLGTAASNVNFTSAWKSSGLTSFELDLSTGTTFTNTFRSSALTSFGGCDLSKGIHFKNTFYLCSNLTEISASAKFGTDAVNVDFDSAFASTGLTSFPALDLSNGTKFYATWFGNNSMSEFGAIDASLGATFADAFKNCSALQSFPSEAKLGTNANNVVFSETWRSNGLTSFSTPLNTGAYFFRAWRDCSSLVDFSAEVLTNWNPSSITTGVFNEAWDGCAALSAQSVENILTSIDVSGQYATSTGASGGSALADAGIDIDYNTATGSLSAATNAAVTSLKAKGWSIIVNNVTL